ncbi:MAG: SDR family oxidoreductase [Alphaproteobacteria bacterium]|nr:SDR family oxidoreductase [Alphaproteobacteria bacterium]
MRTVLITGANRGIGLAHTRRFLARDVRVFATARLPSEAGDLEALGRAHPDRLTILRFDARDPQGPAGLKQALGDQPIDLLLNNAGLGDRHGFGAIDATTFMDVMAVNTLAPLLVAQALAENVAASSRRLIANQSSQLGSIADASGGAYAYRASKAALNMITKALATDLRARGVTVLALHPGWVRTRMGGANAPVDVDACVAGQQAIFDGAGPADSGKFFNYDGKPIPW